VPFVVVLEGELATDADDEDDGNDCGSVDNELTVLPPPASELSTADDDDSEEDTVVLCFVVVVIVVAAVSFLPK
jgi:hypothetical protein